MALEIRADSPGGLDGLGTFYVCLTVFWTLILGGGMAFLYAKRDMPILRIRGLPLSFAAVILLHMYWMAVQTGYIYGAYMAPSIEFWIMGIWLPFGIALFHASNSRFLYVAEMQRRYVGSDRHASRRLLGGGSGGSGRRGLRDKYRMLDYTTKMLTLVGIGMGVQLFLTFFMFIVSRKFHPEFGLPGTELTGTPEERRAKAIQGWEWWPSVFWQFLWAWVVAPVILWRARHLHDTLGWRIQTIGCCLAGLHATPMWLLAIYVPEFGVINQYWIPPQWIAVSIMLLEIFTIFLPCWEVLKHQNLRQETLESIARWEARSKVGGSSSLDSESTYVSWKKPRKSKAGSISSSSNQSVLTMDALEHTLIKNPGPLQQFSALKDFSGENIAFLRRVAEWKSKYYAHPSPERKLSVLAEQEPCGGPPSPTLPEINTRDSFEDALRIYIDFISSRGAEFQVNLSSPDFKKLAAVFENAARIMYGDERTPDPATPFETGDWRVGGPSSGSKGGASASASASASAAAAAASASQEAINAPGAEAIAIDNIRFWGDIPEGFSADVFNDAEISIKYLVLTNTWPKFVRSRRSMDSMDSAESGYSF